ALAAQCQRCWSVLALSQPPSTVIGSSPIGWAFVATTVSRRWGVGGRSTLIGSCSGPVLAVAFVIGVFFHRWASQEPPLRSGLGGVPCGRGSDIAEVRRRSPE